MSIIAALALVACGACGPTAPAHAPSPPVTASAPLPTDPTLVSGTLANGLSYYIRPNAKPEHRVELWLVVNAGSVLEDDDQRGVAHFVEHMAFNGTRKYPKQEIVSWLETIGMSFGPDLNARTTFDETVYQLQVPTDDPALIEHGLDVLHEWAQGISFDPAEVDKERGVILEERRLELGVGDRIRDAIIPRALAGSPYGQRMPIGTEEILKTVPPETLKRFYRDWYRPDLMAVVVVGDVEPAAARALIEARFADLVAPAEPRPRPQPEILAHHDTISVVLTDPELPVTGVAVVGKQPRRVLRSEADLRAKLGEQLFQDMLNARLTELSQQPATPFLGASVGAIQILRPIDVWFQGAAVKGERVEESLAAMSTELSRIAKFGFTETEIARAKENALHAFQRSAEERDKTHSRQLVEEIVSSFLTGDVVSGVAAELELATRLLPGITAGELQAVVDRFVSEENRVVVAVGNSATKLPAEPALVAALAAGKAHALAGYVDDAVTGPLVPTPPAPGTVTSERALTALGATEWTLSNGIRVVLKPTDFQNDFVGVLAYSLGGTSLATDADFVAASNAAAIANVSGAGTLSAVQLQKALAGTSIQVGVQIGGFEQLVYATGVAADVEQMLALAYLRLTGVRKDAAAIEAWRTEQIEARHNQLSDPTTIFDARFEELASNKHPRTRLLTADDFAALDADRALAFYQERFAHLGGFTFVMVGNFALEQVKPLVLTYLGGLPAVGAPERWRDVNIEHPKGAVTFEVAEGIAPKADVHVRYLTVTPWSQEAELDLDALAETLAIRLREELREGMGGTYGVDVSAQLAREPAPHATVDIRFGCAPENADGLIKKAQAIIVDFQKVGPSTEIVDKIKESNRRSLETSLVDNGFWMNALFASYRYGDDPAAILTKGERIAGLTPVRLRAAAKRYLGKDYVLGVLRPKAP